MRKGILFLLSIVMVFTLGACGNANDNVKENDDSDKKIEKEVSKEQPIEEAPINKTEDANDNLTQADEGIVATLKQIYDNDEHTLKIDYKENVYILSFKNDEIFNATVAGVIEKNQSFLDIWEKNKNTLADTSELLECNIAIANPFNEDNCILAVSNGKVVADIAGMDDNTEQASEKETDSTINTAIETTLGAGTFYVGDDIAPGRYDIVAAEGESGNFFIHLPDGEILINEILGNDKEYEVKKITTYIKEGCEIKISGMNTVNFTPHIDTLSNNLGAGYWLVGRDISAGKYIVSVEDGSGNFFIYDSNYDLKTNEILGVDKVNNLTVHLKDSDMIRISGLNNVVFTEKM